LLLLLLEIAARISHLTHPPETQEKLQGKNYHGSYAWLQSFKLLASIAAKHKQSIHPKEPTVSQLATSFPPQFNQQFQF
jgi:hypothetical protein